MDIIFNCPKCEQELAVDASGAGSEINCPSCSEKIVIPAAPRSSTHLPIVPPHGDTGHHVNPIASSAAARVEMHLKVPVHSTPAASLIEKPKTPLEVAAKESDRKLKVKTIRHTDCIEVGHDRFDEVVTGFLQKVGEAQVVSVTPLTYTHLDIGSQKLMTDYAVMIVFRG
jgi:DNA-directed RNA polymerase subunit RPC12/RpoP